MNANPLNYARGLLADIASSDVGGRVERKAHAIEQLGHVVGHLREFDVTDLSDEIKALKAATLTEVEALIGAPKKAARKPVAAA